MNKYYYEFWKTSEIFSVYKELDSDREAIQLAISDIKKGWKVFLQKIEPFDQVLYDSSSVKNGESENVNSQEASSS